MLFIFSTPMFIRYLRQLKTVVFLHRCLILSCQRKKTRVERTFSDTLTQYFLGSLENFQTQPTHLASKIGGSSVQSLGSQSCLCYVTQVNSGKNFANVNTALKNKKNIFIFFCWLNIQFHSEIAIKLWPSNWCRFH